MYLKPTKVSISYQEAFSILRSKKPELFRDMAGVLDETAKNMYREAYGSNPQYVFRDEFVACRRSLVWGDASQEEL